MDFAHKLFSHREFLRLKPIKEAAAAIVRNKWLAERKIMKKAKVTREIEMAENNGEEPLEPFSAKEKKHFFASKEWKKKMDIYREPKLDFMSEAHGADENDLYELRMRSVKPSDISMVVSAMRKNLDNAWMVDQGFEILKRLLDQRDAQKKCIQFGALSQILGGLKIHKDEYNIQLKGVTALRKYTDHGPTQEKAILSPEVTDIAITRLKMFRDKEAMVQEACEILKFTAKLRKNRVRVFEAGTITHITCAIVQYRDNEKILCAAMFLLETLATMAKGKEEILARGLVKIALSVMQQYRESEVVLSASMGMLLLACEDDRGLAQMIHSNGVATTLDAMKHLVHKAELQQRGLEFMKKLASTAKGAKILDGIKGSWQWLAQGTEEGNALVHLLPGPLQSKGWAMGEINEKDNMHKGLLYPEGVDGDARGHAQALWTAGSLSNFMGLSQTEKKMDLNLNEQEFYFDTVKDLGLLPRNGEQREYWFQRIKKFERHHSVNIKDLVNRNQILRFGGDLGDDLPPEEEEEEEEGEEGEEKKKRKKKKAEAAAAAAGSPAQQVGQVGYKVAKRKAMLSGAEKAALKAKNRPPTPSKPTEKRAVFLQDSVSSGWVSKDAPYEMQHNMLYDVDHAKELHNEDGRFVARVAAHHVNVHDTSHLVHLDENNNLVGGDPSVVGKRGGSNDDDDDDDDDDNDDDEEEEEGSNYEGGGSIDDYGDGGIYGAEAGEGEGSMEETAAKAGKTSFFSAPAFLQRGGGGREDGGFYHDDREESHYPFKQVHKVFMPPVKAVVKHGGKVHRGHRLKIAKDLRRGTRLPEKRRDVFHAEDRHGDLFIPKPIEVLFPEVVGTMMESAKHKTAKAQYNFFEDSFRFGKTKEELAAMDAIADLG